MPNPVESSCVLLFAVTLRSPAGDVSYFRHDHGVAGHDRERLPADLSKESSLRWRTLLLPGHSSPCIVGDALYLTTFDSESDQLATVALDRETGERRWMQVAPTTRIEPYHSAGSPASCTVACDGRRVYVFFGSVGLLCYDLSGRLLWRHQMGPFQDEFGACSSPVIAGDRILLVQDHDVGSFLTALDSATGITIWAISREGFTRSYSTPILIDDNRTVVVAGSLRLTAYDVRTGKTKWWVDGLSRIVDPTPVYSNNHIYIATKSAGGDQSNRISMEPWDEALARYDSSDDELVAKTELPEGPVLKRFFRIDLNQDGKLNESEWQKHARVFEHAQNVAISVSTDGHGDVTNSHVEWICRRGLPTVPSCVVYRDVLYMVRNSGIVTSLDARTGKLHKRGRARGPGNYYASLTAGDGKVYLASEGGVVTVLEAGPDWSILASHDFGERIMATPKILDGRIYLRTETAVYCFAKR